MSSRFVCVVVAAGMAAGVTNANADTFTPRLTGGTHVYSLKFDDILRDSGGGGVSFRDGFKIGDSMGFYGGGLTWAHGRFFVDVSGQYSQTGNDATTIFQGAVGSSLGGVGQLHTLDASFKRQELNATLGYALSPNLSVFVGFKRAKTNLEQERAPVLTNPFPSPGDTLQLGTYFMDFDYDGPFAGATYSVPFANKFSLSFQASIADISSSFEQRFEGAFVEYINPLVVRPLSNDLLRSSVDGESFGLNIGMAFTHAITDQFGYTIGVDRSQYKFNNDVRDDPFESADAGENITRVRLDLRYRFGGEN